MRADILRAAIRKAGFRPDQPRVPAGSPDGGRWTDDPRYGAGDATELPLILVSDSPDRPPEIPDEPPLTTRERNRLAVRVANFIYIVTPAIREFEVAAWVYDHARDRIVAFLEPPKTLEELYAQGRGPKPGYDEHHIVEKGSARGVFPDDLIDGDENVVLIPTYRHWEITRWYSQTNSDFGGLSPRAFLRSEPWHIRQQIGLEALRKFGVLK
ncbi:MAG: hypothetical protein AB7O76_04570 [Rhizobiaceae bacterium]